MNYNTQNAKIASITEKTLIVGIDVGSETHYARAFDWRNYEYSKNPLEFSNTVQFSNFMCCYKYVNALRYYCGESANEKIGRTIEKLKICLIFSTYLHII